LGEIKIKHGPEFIVDIASFQLIQKSSNLVMFWLPKMPLKVTKKSAKNDLIWVNLSTLVGYFILFVYKCFNTKINTFNRLGNIYGLGFTLF